MEDNTQTVDTTTTTAEVEKNVGEKAGKFLTQDEVNKVVESRLAREREVAEKQKQELQANITATYEKKLKAIEEAEKLKSMTDSERLIAEKEMLEKELAEYRQEKLVSQFKVELTTKGLKADFADLIPVGDADKAKKAVDFLGGYKAEIEKPYLEKIKALEDQLRNGALKGGVPTVPNGKVEPAKSLKQMY